MRITQPCNFIVRSGMKLNKGVKRKMIFAATKADVLSICIDPKLPCLAYPKRFNAIFILSHCQHKMTTFLTVLTLLSFLNYV